MKKFKYNEPMLAGWYCLEGDMIIYNASKKDIDGHLKKHKRETMWKKAKGE